MLITVLKTDSAEIGFQISNLFWNRGYGTEIAVGGANIVKNIMKIPNCLALVNKANYKSIKVLENANFKNTKTTQKGRLVYEIC